MKIANLLESKGLSGDQNNLPLNFESNVSSTTWFTKARSMWAITSGASAPVGENDIGDAPSFGPMLIQAMNLMVDASTVLPIISTKVSVTL